MSKWSHRLILAALFGLADGIGFLLGVGVGALSPLRMSGEFGELLEIALPAILGIYLIAIAFLVFGAQRAGTQVARAQSAAAVVWPVWILPIILALDNFSFGLVGNTGGQSILQMAFGEQAWSSALLAAVGFGIGVLVLRALPALQRRAVAATASGVGLILFSVILVSLESLE